MCMVGMRIRKNITLNKKHAEWIKNHHINLSRFVQAKIDEEIIKEESSNVL